MNFPMMQPIFQFFYWLVNTPGLGGIVLLVLSLGAVLVSLMTINWISSGKQDDESDSYSYPTSSLFHDE